MSKKTLKRFAIIAPGGLPIPATSGGAVETLIDLLLNALKNRSEIAVDVFSSDKDLKTIKKFSSGNITYYQIPQRFAPLSLFRRILFHFKPWLYYDWYIKTIQNIILNQKQSYDALLIENQPQFVEPFAKMINCPIYLHLHNEDWHLRGYGCRSVAKETQAVFTVSHFIENFVKMLHPCANVITIYNGIDLTVFHPCLENKNKVRERYGIPLSAFALFFTGRVCKSKGVEELVKAYSQIPPQNNCVLVVIGSTWFGRTETDEFTRKLNDMTITCENPIIFTGYLPNRDVASLESALDLAVLPSLWDDPFPLSVLEAMACGVPVITTRSGGIPEAVTEDCGIVLERDERLADNLNKEILRLMADNALCLQLGRNAKQRAECLFSSERYTHKMIHALLHNNSL